MFPAILEFVADQPDSVQVGAHGELFIFGLVFMAARTFLGQGLMIERQGKDNIAADFPSVKLAVEAAKFHRVVPGEKAVQVQKMIAAGMVVALPAFVVSGVPDSFDIAHGFGFHAVHSGNQIRVQRFAEPHPVRLDLQGFVEKVVLAGDDIDEVADAARRMICAVQMNMNSAGAVCEAALSAEHPNQFLQGFDIAFVVQDGADQFDAEFAGGRKHLTARLFLCANTAVAHDLPDPAIRRMDILRVVVVAAAFHPSAQIPGGGLCGLRPCDSGEFNLNAKSCAEHIRFLPFKCVSSVTHSSL